MQLVQVKRVLIYQGNKDSIDKTLQNSYIQPNEVKDFGNLKIYEDSRVEQPIDVEQIKENL